MGTGESIVKYVDGYVLKYCTAAMYIDTNIRGYL